MRKQFSLDCDKYVIQANKEEKRKLNGKRKEILCRIGKVEKKIKAVKFKDSEYSIKLELIGKMKVYVKKYAFLPRSYHNMLNQWNGLSAS